MFDGGGGGGGEVNMLLSPLIAKESQRKHMFRCLANLRRLVSGKIVESKINCEFLK